MNIPIKLSLQTRKSINFPFCVPVYCCCCFFLCPLHTSTYVRCKWWPNRGVLLINIRCRVQCYAFGCCSSSSSCFDCLFGVFGVRLGSCILMCLVLFLFPFFAKLTLFEEGVELFKRRLVCQKHLSNRIFITLTKPLTN